MSIGSILETTGSSTPSPATAGAELRAQYGPRIGWPELLRILEDRARVRYPCKVVFDSRPLIPGEFAYPVARGQRPEDGFTMFVHPRFEDRLEQVPGLVLYQLVLVNEGPFASPGDAEAFGAAALGLSRTEYRRSLCRLVNEVCEADAGAHQETVNLWQDWKSAGLAGASPCPHL